MRRPRPALLGVGLMGLGLILACGPSAEGIAEARAQYVAALDGFVVRQEPSAPRLRQDVELALAVRRQAPPRKWARRSRTWTGETPEGLPGITLDVEQVDAQGKSRRHWRVWVDTAGLEPGREIRTGHVLEDIDYAPGDGFRVEVRPNIPAAERVEYREWQEPGASTSSGPAS